MRKEPSSLLKNLNIESKFKINLLLLREKGPQMINKHSSDETESNEDVEITFKELMNVKSFEEHKLFHNPSSHQSESEYETLGNLRMKRMRESLESPVFGSKMDSWPSQKNVIWGLTLTSKDELENAHPKKPSGQIFKKKLRFYSFHETDNSSFPSSHNTLGLNNNTPNSIGSNSSNRTSNFNVKKRENKKSNLSRKSGKLLKNPKNFKNHLKSIAFLVGAHQNILPIPNTVINSQ